MTEKYGGLAFPRSHSGDRRGNSSHHAQPGMTLLDYFAGQALPEVMRQAAADPEGFRERAMRVGLSVFDLIGEHALGQAEAMLDRRKALMGNKQGGDDE